MIPEAFLRFSYTYLMSSIVFYRKNKLITVPDEELMERISVHELSTAFGAGRGDDIPSVWNYFLVSRTQNSPRPTSNGFSSNTAAQPLLELVVTLSKSIKMMAGKNSTVFL
jgi:hypothetical protein